MADLMADLEGSCPPTAGGPERVGQEDYPFGGSSHPQETGGQATISMPVPGRSN